MRLTNKVCIQGKLRYGCKPRLDRQYNRNETNDITNTPEIIDKLGQLEDIEEELGIDFASRNLFGQNMTANWVKLMILILMMNTMVCGLFISIGTVANT